MESASDAGSDAGLRDGGATDGGATDGGEDGGIPDAGAGDGGAGPDAGWPDAGLGERCDRPFELAGAETVTGTTRGAADDYGQLEAGCLLVTGARNGAGDVAFAVSVPANARLEARLTTDGGWRPTLALVGDALSCGAPISSGDGGASGTWCAGSQPGTDRVAFASANRTATRVLLVVDGEAAGEAGDFALAVRLTANVDGDRCEAPEVLTLPADGGWLVLSGQTLAGYSDDYLLSGSACATSGSGADRVYEVQLPPINPWFSRQVTAFVEAEDGGRFTVSGARSAADCSGRRCTGYPFEPDGGDDRAAHVVVVGDSPSGRVLLVVEATGNPMAGRHWSSNSPRPRVSPCSRISDTDEPA